MFKIKKNQKNDYILMLAAASLLILTGSIAVWFPSAKKQSDGIAQLEPKIIGRAELTIKFGDDKERNFEGEIVENETLIDVLAQSSKAGNFSYELDANNNLAAIENFTAKASKSWHWYLNNEKISKPLNGIILKDSDKILIKYE